MNLINGGCSGAEQEETRTTTQAIKKIDGVGPLPAWSIAASLALSASERLPF
jgi:hypothetical protein